MLKQDESPRRASDHTGRTDFSFASSRRARYRGGLHRGEHRETTWTRREGQKGDASLRDRLANDLVWVVYAVGMAAGRALVRQLTAKLDKPNKLESPEVRMLSETNAEREGTRT